MVKSYLRYEQKDVFGLIASCPCEILIVPGTKGRLALIAASERVNIWNVREGILLGTLVDGHNRVATTKMALDLNLGRVAVGYANGEIRIFDWTTRELIMSLKAHSSAVTALAYNSNHSLLASGSADTDIALWDVLSESGLYRLQGHRDEITDLQFYDLITTDSNVSEKAIASRCETQHMLISSSKDCLLKMWDLDEQHCVHTITGHRGEVWSFDILKRPSDTCAVLVAGSTDRYLRIWRIPAEITVSTSRQVSNGAIDSATQSRADISEQVSFVGQLERPAGRKRVERVRFDKSGGDARALVVYGADHAVDFFLVRSLESRARKQRRRAKRLREREQRQKRAGDFTAVASGETNLETTTGENVLIQRLQYSPADDLDAQMPVRLTSRVAAVAFNSPSLGNGAQDESLLLASVLVALSNNELQTWAVLLQSVAADNVADEAESGKEQLPTTHTKALKSPTQGGTLAECSSISLPGHRSGVRVLALSSDDSLLLSAAGNQLKLWNVSTKNCIRTIEVMPEAQFAVSRSISADSTNSRDSLDVSSAIFVPGNRHVLVGTRSGRILLYELANSKLVANEAAHDGAPVWALDLSAQSSSFASGGGREIWFWEFELIDESQIATENGVNSSSRGKTLSFSHARTLKLTDDVLCVRHSPDGKHVAVALLDCSVRIFYEDTLAFYLSLYGHKLPVISMDITSDSSLIATGSADKTVKIWGLDFGDCHKSIHAHDNSVMRVQFVPKTHYMFTTGKDSLVKYWDADRYEEILQLRGHHAEVWALAVASKGQFVVSSGVDRSIRLWQRTHEQVFVEEERMHRLQEALERDSRESTRYRFGGTGSDAIGEMVGGIHVGKSPIESKEAWRGAIARNDAIAFGERLVQCLNVCHDEAENWRRYHEAVNKRRKELVDVRTANGIAGSISASSLKESSKANELSTIAKPLPHPMLQGSTPSQFILRTLRSAKQSDITDALLDLPYDLALQFMQMLCKLLEEGNEVETCMKCCLLLVRLHHHQMVASGSLGATLSNLRVQARTRLTSFRDLIGTNIAGLRLLVEDLSRSFESFGVPEPSTIGNASRRKFGTTPRARHKEAKKRRRVTAV